jgi:hypothetical protein
MLKHADDIKLHLKTMVEDLAEMNRISGLGFTEQSAERIEENLVCVAEEDAWSYLDLRSADADAGRSAIKSVRGPVLVVVTSAKEPTRPILELVRAYVDDTELRPRGRSVFLLCEGASDFEELHPDLQRIPLWKFVPQR